jgi:WD40 repeat protein
LASGGADAKVKLWDVTTAQELATLRGHSATIWSLAFSPDGMTLATASQDSTIKLWLARDDNVFVARD